jgi:demethoxyubiquinone hydroxylase (CLK1/Coq7/Cat5 family)
MMPAIKNMNSATTTSGSLRCDALTVMFDGACPLCRREVGVYQQLTPLQPVVWTDVSALDATVLSEQERQKFLSRFHVRLPGGEWLSGAAAFVALWLSLPGWRWLGRLAALPGVTPLLERTYSGFLRYRPALQRLAAQWDVAHLPANMPAGMLGDLRSDHAGETGAVWIYRGILAVSRDESVRAFALRHLHTEQGHIRHMQALLPPLRRSWLLVPWRMAGWVTGALPALMGPQAVFATIGAVETFVDQHYQQQLDRLAGRPGCQSLFSLMAECQQDEREHRDESLAQVQPSPGWLLSVWCRMVGRGSAVAVWLARSL